MLQIREKGKWINLKDYKSEDIRYMKKGDVSNTNKTNKANKEIIRYDQGANTYESTAIEAAGYSNALVEKLKEQFEKRYKEEDDN